MCTQKKYLCSIELFEIELFHRLTVRKQKIILKLNWIVWNFYQNDLLQHQMIGKRFMRCKSTNQSINSISINKFDHSWKWLKTKLKIFEILKVLDNFLVDLIHNYVALFVNKKILKTKVIILKVFILSFLTEQYTMWHNHKATFWVKTFLIHSLLIHYFLFVFVFFCFFLLLNFCFLFSF